MPQQWSSTTCQHPQNSVPRSGGQCECLHTSQCLSICLFYQGFASSFPFVSITVIVYRSLLVSVKLSFPVLLPSSQSLVTKASMAGKEGLFSVPYTERKEGLRKAIFLATSVSLSAILSPYFSVTCLGVRLVVITVGKSLS